MSEHKNTADAKTWYYSCGCEWVEPGMGRKHFSGAGIAAQTCSKCQPNRESQVFRLQRERAERKPVTTHTYNEDAGVVTTHTARPRHERYDTRGGSICGRCGGPCSDYSGDCGECR